MHAPEPAHFDAVHRILRYLKGIPGKGILFQSIERRDEFIPIYVETRVPGEKPRLFVVIIF